MKLSHCPMLDIDTRDTQLPTGQTERVFSETTTCDEAVGGTDFFQPVLESIRQSSDKIGIPLEDIHVCVSTVQFTGGYEFQEFRKPFQANLLISLAGKMADHTHEYQVRLN